MCFHSMPTDGGPTGQRLDCSGVHSAAFGSMRRVYSQRGERHTGFLPLLCFSGTWRGCKAAVQLLPAILHCHNNSYHWWVLILMFLIKGAYTALYGLAYAFGTFGCVCFVFKTYRTLDDGPWMPHSTFYTDCCVKPTSLSWSIH